MKKFIIALVIISIITFVGFVVAKNFFGRRLIEIGAEKTLGVNITIRDLDVSPLGSHLRIKGLIIDNPQGFEKKEMVYIPSIDIVCDPVEYIKNKKIQVHFFDLNVERINIIKNKQGLVNIKEIQTIKNKGGQKSTKVPFFINILRLNLADIYYIDYHATSSPKPTRYRLDIKNAFFSNVDSPHDIINLVVLKILSNTEISKLIDMSIIPIAKDVQDIIVLPARVAKDAIKGVIGIPASLFKNTP